MNEWEWSLLEDKARIEVIEVDGVEIRVGDRVRLRPRRCADILDIALRGQSATIESLEQDYEGKQHVCVVLDDDPGRDLGMMRQPGHRFFFDSTEIEPMSAEAQTPRKAPAMARILVAGVGNIFLGDDGFGVEVIRRLAQRSMPDSVRVVDFGIRGLDLAYALQDGYETTILIDAYPSGEEPGTVSIVEPDCEALNSSQANFVEPHSMHPINVLRMASAMHGPMGRLLLIGCEPLSLGGDEGHIGLSKPVEVAVEQAVRATEDLVHRIVSGDLNLD